MDRLRFLGSVLFLLTYWCAGSAATILPQQREGEAPHYQIVPIPDPRFVDVLVVDAKTGDAVAGAVVTSFRTWDDWSKHMPLLPEELARILAENGPGVATDESGHARVPRAWRILATAGDRTAVGSLDPSMDSLRLDLVENVALTVLVEDEEGRSIAGVPVVLQSPCDEQSAWTDESGRVVFSPLSLWYSELRGDHWVGSHLYVDAPLGEAVFEGLPPDFDPAVPLRLTLPPFGSLRLDVVDEDGNEVRDLDSLFLYPPKGMPLQPGERTVREWSGFDLVAGTNPRLPFVGLRLRFDLHVDNDLQFGSADAIGGPRAPGEEVVVRVVMPRATHASVRVLDESGSLFANRSILLCVDGPWDAWETRSDSSGEVDITLESGFEDGIDERTLLEAYVRDEEGALILSGATTLFLERPGHLVGSKDVVLSRPQVLFTGRIVDDEGSPVAGASVEVRVYPEAPRTGLMPHPVLGATSDQDGCFEVRGLPSVRRMNAYCNAPPLGEGGTVYSWRTSFRDVEVGDRDVVLELRRTSLVVGTFVGSEEDLEGLAFENEQNLADYPRFVLELPDGTANLKLVGRHGMERQIDLGEIPVLPGQMTLLGEIAIGGGDHTVHLTVLDDQGERIPAGWIALPDPEVEARWAQAQQLRQGQPMMMALSMPRDPKRIEFEDGTAILPADEALPPFAVGAPGFAPTVTRSLGGSHLVVLRKAPVVRLVADLPAGCGIPEGNSLIALFRPNPDDPEWFRFGGGDEGRADFGEAAKQILELVPGEPTPAFVPFGEVCLRLLLGVRSADGYSGSGLLFEPNVLEIEETAEEQIFHLKIDAESFRRATQRRD